jgi:hypothetical protein
MNDDIRVRIDDDDAGDSAPQRSSSVDVNTKAVEAERNRAFAERASLENQLVQTRRAHLDAELRHVVTAGDAATAALTAALEAGDFTAVAARQREISQIETRRLDLENTAAQFSAQPRQPADPVEAYAQNRTEPTKKWLREHRDWVVDPQKNARLTSAHYAAVAEGLEPDSDRYFEHVEKTIGLRDGGRGRSSGDNESGSDGVTVRKLKAGDPIPHGAVKLSRGELAAATDGTLRYGYDDPHGRFKRDDPIGIREFVRRKQELQKQGRYFKLESS